MHVKVGFTLRCAVVVWLILAAHSVSTVNADSPVLVDSLGVWTFKQLKYDGLAFVAGGQSQDPLVLYRLPPGASQGPDSWYLVNLHFSVELDEQAASGFAYLSASTNGHAAAQIKFETTRASNGSLATKWSSVDLVNGRIERTETSRSVEGRFSNYLQVGGVQGGVNALSFELEQFGGTSVKRVNVFADSGIEYTRLSPPKLHLEVEFPDENVRLGDEFIIKYVATNVGGRPASRVSVGARYPSGGLLLMGKTPQLFTNAESTVNGQFAFTAITVGSHRVAIAVDSPGSRPVVEIEVRVQPPGGHNWADVLWDAPWFVSLPTLLLLASAMTFIVRYLGGRWRRQQG